jgi:hypothetical protein
VKLRVLAREGPGRVTVRECLVCGYFEWASTQRDVPDEVVVEVVAPADDPLWVCPKCLEVVRRAPEVYAWVVDVVRHNLYLDDES